MSAMYPFPTLYNVGNPLSFFHKNLPIQNGFRHNGDRQAHHHHHHQQQQQHAESNFSASLHADPNSNANSNSHLRLNPDAHNPTNLDTSTSNKNSCVSHDERQHSSIQNPEEVSNQLADSFMPNETLVSAQKLFKCDTCGKLFAQKTNLQNHERTHTGHKPFVCLVCMKAFSQRTNLKNHERIHSGERPYICMVCSKTFSQRTNLRNHERIHSGERPYKCMMCPKAFSQLTNLRNHERTHTGVKPYACNVCLKSFAQQAELTCHERVHTGIKPYACSYCLKAFSQLTNLRNHERIHTKEKPFKCGVCIKAFSQRTDLHNHLRVHTKEKPFCCTDCPKAFAQRTDLKNHLRTHSGEKPYVCLVCGKAFSQVTNLRNHERIHSGEKPFSCSVCGKAFSQRSTLKNHERTHGIGFNENKTQDQKSKCMQLNCHGCEVCQDFDNSERNADGDHERLYCSRNDVHHRLSNNAEASEKMSTETQEKSSLTCDVCQKEFSHRVQLNNHVCIESADEASNLLPHQTFLRECQSATTESIISKWITNCMQQQQQDKSKEMPSVSGGILPTPSSSSSSATPNSASLYIQSNSHIPPVPENPWFFLGADARPIAAGGAGDLRLQSALLSSGYLHTMPPGWSNHYGWPRGLPVTPRWGAVGKDLTSSGIGLGKEKDSKVIQKSSSKTETAKAKSNNACDNPTNSSS